ncbi:MAG: arginine--tRNA ligase [Elusimicrobia bacterium]|nr:arginine--tRNA ligase [Elusimicrobiota bacterium]
MSSIRQELERLIAGGLTPWCQRQGLDTPPVVALEEPPAGFSADLACNAAFALAKALRRRPADVAEVIGRSLAAASHLVSQVEVVPSGFINILLSRERLAAELRLILKEKDRYGASPEGARPPILIEFVSANPTGPLHVGHGRGAAIGDSLARLFAFQGHPVIREYYVNDMGTQTELLAQSVEARYGELQGEARPFPEQGYRGGYVTQIARQLAEELAGHPGRGARGKTAWFGQRAQEILLAEITEDLRTFRITFDRWFRESDLHREQVIPRVIAQLRSRGVAYDEGGAVWVATERYGDEKARVVIREDGRPTYFAADIAYHLQKLTIPGIRLINVWGADHHGYAPRLRAVLQALEIEPARLTIVLYQLVALAREGRPVPMSTRAGEFITLREVMQEVGVDACRFFFPDAEPRGPTPPGPS